MEKKPYYLSIDPNTSGIAVVAMDENFDIVRKKGKQLAIFREIQETETAEKRRMQRTSRKNQKHRKERVKCLRELFGDCFDDSEFILRLDESNLMLEDKSHHSKYILFDDDNFNDKDFHKKYPTIAHLKKALIENNEDARDPRFVFLAILHIISNRGHFLYEGANIDDLREFDPVAKQMFSDLSDILKFKVNKSDLAEMKRVLTGTDSKKDKLSNLKSILVPETSKMDKDEAKIRTKAAEQVCKFLVGYKGNVNMLFYNTDFSAVENTSFAFSGMEYEELITPIYESDFPEEFKILESIKAVHDWVLFSKVLDGESYFSYAQVNKYEKHKSDKTLLKQYMKRNCTDDVYNKFFFENDGVGYSTYVGKIFKKGKTINIDKMNDHEPFFKNLTKIIEGTNPKLKKDNKIKEQILEDIQNENFLPLQRSKANTVIPMQINELELKVILDNAKKYMTWLNEEDEYGTIADKILSIFRFKVPYFVGPLSTNHPNSRGWVVRQNDKTIKPWNLMEVVDKFATNENFIRRMTKPCTYLLGEDVLPKESLYYQFFNVMNELNVIKVKGENISVEDKQKVFTELFMKKNKVTNKDLMRILGIKEASDLGGINENIKSTFSSFNKFKNKVFALSDKEYSVEEFFDICENIILWSTLYGKDKRMLVEMIERVYPDEFSNEQLNAIKAMSFGGWGNLSRKFLVCMEGANVKTGEVASVLKTMWDTTCNLSQILSCSYTYTDEVSRMNKEKMSEGFGFTYESLIEPLNVSPAIKGKLWDSMKTLKELIGIMGYPPKEIYIELPRGEEKNKERTKSRKEQLLNLYKGANKSIKQRFNLDAIKLIEKMEERDFRDDKVYLWFLQQGRCAYTDAQIDLNDINNVSRSCWDKDHIYPQSLFDDSSLNNVVLVSSVTNLEKGNGIIKKEIQNKMKPIWNMWLKNGFITQEKYDRLTRTTLFNNDDFKGFINRQLVQTGQTALTLYKVLELVYPETKVVKVRAQWISSFRKDYCFPKSRAINKFHHVSDAYLCGVVGRIYEYKYLNNFVAWSKSKEGAKYNIQKTFDYDIPEINWIGPDKITNSKGKTVLKKNERGEVLGGTTDKIRRAIEKENFIYTKKTLFINGGFYDENLSRADQNPTFPVKEGMDLKYGGYKTIKRSYYHVIEYDGRKEREKTIVGVPIIIKERNKPSAFVEFCENVLGYKNVEVISKPIRSYSLFDIDGYKLRLKGENDKTLIFEQNEQFKMDKDHKFIAHRVEKLSSKYENAKVRKENSEFALDDKIDKISESDLIDLYDYFIMRLQTNPYDKRPGNPVNSLVELKDDFVNATVVDKMYILMQVLNLFSTNASPSADLTVIGGKATVGKIGLSKGSFFKHDVVLIEESKTGVVFQNCVNL